MKDLAKLWRPMALRAPANDNGHSGGSPDVGGEGEDEYTLDDPALTEDGGDEFGGEEEPALEEEADELEDEPADDPDDLGDPKEKEGQGKGKDPKAGKKPTEGSNKDINNGKGEQPNDKLLAEFNKALGKITVNGKPFEGVRDIDHAKRLIQKGITSDVEIERANARAAQAENTGKEAAQKYEKARAPWDWIAQTVKAGGPMAKKAFDYLRHEPKMLATIIAAIPEWEKAGELDPRVIDMAVKDLEVSELKGQNEQRSKAEAAARHNTYVQEQLGKITELNNGHPISPELRQLVAAVWNQRKKPETSIVAAYRHVMKTMGAHPAVKGARRKESQDEAARRKAGAGTGSGSSRPPAGKKKTGTRSPEEWAAALANSESWGKAQ